MATNTSFARRAGVLVAVTGVALAGWAGVAAAAPAVAAVDGPSMTLAANTNCNGILPTPGSENTTKQLVGGTMQPGGTAVFQIDFPVDADDVGKEFTITDCVLLDGEEFQKWFIEFVPNNTSYILEYELEIPETAELGVEYCNYAKTTGSPSASQASNRKAGPACFNVGGTLRVEKRAGSAEGDLLPGATFSVECDTGESSTPPLVIDGLDEAGVATTGVIAINGPEGTSCDIEELAAPEGYELAEDPTQTVTIPRGEGQTVSVFVNTLSVEPTEEPTEEPTIEPTDGPTVEPTDPAPSISPTVLGVKIVKPSLPQTGTTTVPLVALGLALAVAGAAMVFGAGRYQRQH